MNRSIPLIFILVLTASSLMIVKPEQAVAQTPTQTSTPQVTPSSNATSMPTPTPTPSTPLIPTPTPIYPKLSVPEFTLKLISSLPEANKTTIELTIKNQPFDENNIYNYSFFYNVRIKTNDENWTDLYNPEDGYPTQSNTNYTVLSYVSGESAYYPSSDYPLSPSMKVGILPSIGPVDFQVEAMIGYRDRGTYSAGIMPYVFKGITSGWSNTQTITIPDTSAPATASPTPNQSPSSAPNSSPTPPNSPTQQPTATPTQSTNPTTTPNTQNANPLPIILALVALVIIAITITGLTIQIRKQKRKIFPQSSNSPIYSS